MKTVHHLIQSFKSAPWAVLLLVVALQAGGCGLNVPSVSPVDYSLPNGSVTDGTIVFMVDCVNASHFEQMLQRGELPNIQKYFVDRGLYCPRAVASTPSVTLPNETSLVTGLFPGHHEVFSIRWFDRNQLVWRDYATIGQKNMVDSDYQAATLFEQFPDRTTFSLFYQAHRGVSFFQEDYLSAGIPFGLGWYEFVDRLTLHRMQTVARTAKARHEFPAVTFCYLLAADFEGYTHGFSSPQYDMALKHCDYQIGKVLQDIERSGLLDKLFIALVSDHGVGDVKTHLVLEPFLRKELGLAVAHDHLWESSEWSDRMKYYGQHACVLAGSGDRAFGLYLRKPIRENGKVTGLEPWPLRPAMDDLRAYPAKKNGADVTLDLLTVLTQPPAVDAVAYVAGPNLVRVRRKTGEVEFRQEAGRGGPITYQLIQGSDPLGYAAKVPPAVLAGAPLDSRQWLEATHDTPYPDLPAQILAFFRSRRAPDLALFGSPNWDFCDENHDAHGGITAMDMQVPLLIAGPGIAKQRIDVARSADLTPTILKLMHRPVPPNLDGVPLLPTNK